MPKTAEPGSGAAWPPVVDRFLRYVRIDTQSDPDSTSVPSTQKQKVLGRVIQAELTGIGLDAAIDEYGYVWATLPATSSAPDGDPLPVIALLAHMDTSPDAPGAGVRPIVHPPYRGETVILPGNPSVTLDPARQPALLEHVGENLITSDGTTLLGSDDKAGVAILVQLAADLVADSAPRPEVRLCFTVDEEIGRGVDHLDLGRLSARIAYTIDGSDVDTISFETFNAAEATVTVHGVGVHPGYARGVMVNAVRIVGRLVAALPAAESPEHTDGVRGFIHPHTLAAGDVGRASVRLILRDFSAGGLERRKRLVSCLVESLRLEYPAATIDLEIRDQYRNMRSYIEEIDPRAVHFAREAAAGIGITLRPERVRGGTDGSRLSEAGIPTPNLFNGGMDYHSCFEWNTVQGLERSLRFVRTVVRYWGEHGHETRTGALD
jgi:tripeptide aminopeptidase